MTNFTNFEKAAYFAVEGRELEDDCDNLLNEVVETAEAIDNFRPVDVMSNKKAGREEMTPYGLVVIRKTCSAARGLPAKRCICSATNPAT